MKKIRIHNLLLFLFGLISLSVGVILAIKSDLGVSVALSVPYIFSLYFTKLSLGQWNYIVQGFVLLLLVLIIKRLSVKHLMSFVVAFLFGLTIDLFDKIFIFVKVNTLIGRLGLFALGNIGIAIGISLFIKSNYPILPFDTFVNEVSEEKEIVFSKVKTTYDLSSFIVSFVFSLIFFKSIKGIHIGTLISALILGYMIGSCLKIWNKNIDGISIMPTENIKGVMDYELFNLNNILLDK